MDNPPFQQITKLCHILHRPLLKRLAYPHTHCYDHNICSWEGQIITDSQKINIHLHDKIGRIMIGGTLNIYNIYNVYLHDKIDRIMIGETLNIYNIKIFTIFTSMTKSAGL